ncbi:hypothetical protein L5515_019055 [Caenorhabditis briggsae]|uniref:Uncharacterized protein n=3 Tax=Caenorhabditis briggsae TaxID=6238 RepID=A0AAE9JSN3_CAEBR|nr:hypothetical protein L5515_019055 [Caenorhabditis briggsae]
MFPDTLVWCLILLIVSPNSSSGFYFSRRDANRVICSSSFEDQCTMEERSRLQATSVDMITRKHQDRVISIRHFLKSQMHIFNDFFSKTLRTIHMDLDLMFSNTYGSFYQENIDLVNDFFKKIKGYSVSFAETSMKTIVQMFFDELFQVMFSITNPFYVITNEQRQCMEAFYREIEAFDDIPQKITNQLSLPLSNWKHFLGSLESLHEILEGYLNITLKEECERGLSRMEVCSECQRISEKPCRSYCVNILSGCTHQMLDSEGAWRNTIESMIRLSNQLNHRQNLVSALQPIPVLISEAVMHFQEKRDFITNKMIGKCLLDNSEFGLRRKRSLKPKHKIQPVIVSKKSRDHLILNQMFDSFNSKLEEWKIFFGNLPEELCGDEDWSSQDDEKCWNGTDVGRYNLPEVNYTHPFKNPEYQGIDFLTFRGSYIEERLRLHWLQSRISHVLSGKESQKSGTYYSKAEARIQTDDEDYNDYDYEGSANAPGSGSSKPEYSPYFKKTDNDKIEIVIEPFPVKFVKSPCEFFLNYHMQEDNDGPRKSRKSNKRIEETDTEESVNDETTYSSSESDFVEETVEYLDKDGEQNVRNSLDEEEDIIVEDEEQEEDNGDDEEEKEEEEEEKREGIAKVFQEDRPLDVIERAVRLRNIGNGEGYVKDIGLLFGTTALLGAMIYLVLALLGLTMPSRPLVVPKGAVKPFFIGMHRRLIEDSFDGTIRLSANQTLSVILLYSPYSIKSKWFRDEYFNTARNMKKLHGDLAPYFGATNCFDSNTYCRSKYNLKQYPAIMAQSTGFVLSVYNGPLNSLYLSRWINRLQNPIFRLHSPGDLRHLAEHHDLIVILYYQIKTPPQAYQSAANYTRLAFDHLNGDPNSERTIFCMVTDPTFANQLQLHNEHDLILVSSELRLLATHYKGWTNEAVHNDVLKYSKEKELMKVEFLNLGRQFHSTQLAEKFEQGSVLMYFSRDLTYGSEKYKMFREIAREYQNCAQANNILSIVNENEEILFEEDCSISLENKFCKANNTLSFLAIDSSVESALAVKYGAETEDMVIAINTKQEVTRYIRKNITRGNINCLIRQHHNAAENEFVVEAAQIVTQHSSTTPENLHSDAVGEPSSVKFVSNATALLTSKKINVILFSGGIWHSASSSAIAPFHLVADHFKEAKSIIDFSMVDVSETSLPYNLDFDQLPKILITSADSIGLSWTYPEEFMINHTNIARFVLTRPGKIFGRLRWLDACQGICRKRSRWQMRNKRLQIKRQLSRNVANSMRQRQLLGYYDRMLRLIN